MRKSIFIILSLCFVWACKKDPKLTDNTADDSGFGLTNSIDVNITNVAGNVPLALTTGTYVNENLDTFSVNVYRYYISNIKLFRQDGFIFTEPESYRLIMQDDTSSCKFSIPNVPLGDYIGMEFIIGVDSLRNCDGAQTGALDIVHDMFWSWSQGYIFAKMEGTCNRSPGGVFYEHIGGFTLPYNAIVKSIPPFGSNRIQVTSEHRSKVYMKADILEWFKTPSTIDLSTSSSAAMGKQAAEIAANYADMFSIVSIKN